MYFPKCISPLRDYIARLEREREREEIRYFELRVLPDAVSYGCAGYVLSFFHNTRLIHSRNENAVPKSKIVVQRFHIVIVLFARIRFTVTFSSPASVVVLVVHRRMHHHHHNNLPPLPPPPPKQTSS